MIKEEIDNPNTIEKILCAKCKLETNHTVLAKYKSSDDDIHGTDGAIDWWDSYEIVKCNGCDTAGFRHISYFSEHAAPWDNGLVTKLYPHREKGGRSIISFDETPMKLDKLYAETINAFNSDLLILCAGGVRAILECICIDKGIAGGNVIDQNNVSFKRENLQGKISGLSERGYITLAQSAGLHQHRYLGNDALHEIIQPLKKELSIAIDILEHAIKQIYDIPENTKQLERFRNMRNPNS